MIGCDLCHEPASHLYRVVIRLDRPVPWGEETPASADYREAIVCAACHDELVGSPTGEATIGGLPYSLAGVSRTHSPATR